MPMQIIGSGTRMDDVTIAKVTTSGHIWVAGSISSMPTISVTPTGSQEVFTSTGSVEIYGTLATTPGSESVITAGSVEVYQGTITDLNTTVSGTVSTNILTDPVPVSGVVNQGTSPWAITGSVSMYDVGSVQLVPGSIEVYQTTAADMQISGVVTVSGIFHDILGSVYVSPLPLPVSGIFHDILGSVSVQQDSIPWITSGTATVAGSIYTTGSIRVANLYEGSEVWQGTDPWVISGLVNLGSGWQGTGSVHVTNPSTAEITGSVEVYSSTGSVEIYGALTAEAGSESYIKGGSIFLYSGATNYVDVPNRVAGSIVNMPVVGISGTVIGVSGIVNQGTDPWVISGVISNLDEVVVTVGSESVVTAGSIQTYDPIGIGSVHLVPGSLEVYQTTAADMQISGTLDVNILTDPVPVSGIVNLGTQWAGVGSVVISGTVPVTATVTVGSESWIKGGSIQTYTPLGSTFVLGSVYTTGSIRVANLYAGSETYIKLGSVSLLSSTGSIPVYTLPTSTGSLNISNFAAIGSQRTISAGSVIITDIQSPTGSIEVFQTTNADMQVQVTQETSPWVVSGTATVSGIITIDTLPIVGVSGTLVGVSGIVNQGTSPWVVSGIFHDILGSVNVTNLLGSEITGTVDIGSIFGVIDAGNSSTTNLIANGSFFGAGIDVSNHATVTTTVFADESSATDGMTFQFSTDNTNWDDIYQFTLTSGGGTDKSTRRFQFPVTAQYFRVGYTNDTDPQGAFRVQTILHPSNKLTSVHRVGDLIDPDRSVFLTKAVLTAQKPGGGDFTPIDATTAGNLKVAIEDFDTVGSVVISGTSIPVFRGIGSVQLVPGSLEVYQTTAADLQISGTVTVDNRVAGSIVNMPIVGISGTVVGVSGITNFGGGVGSVLGLFTDSSNTLDSPIVANGSYLMVAGSISSMPGVSVSEGAAYLPSGLITDLGSVYFVGGERAGSIWPLQIVGGSHLLIAGSISSMPSVTAENSSDYKVSGTWLGVGSASLVAGNYNGSVYPLRLDAGSQLLIAGSIRQAVDPWSVSGTVSTNILTDPVPVSGTAFEAVWTGVGSIVISGTSIPPTRGIGSVQLVPGSLEVYQTTASDMQISGVLTIDTLPSVVGVSGTLVGVSGIVNQGTVPWEVSGTATISADANSVFGISGTVIGISGVVNQGTDPWVISGVVNVGSIVGSVAVSNFAALGSQRTISAGSIIIINELTISEVGSPCYKRATLVASGTYTNVWPIGGGGSTFEMHGYHISTNKPGYVRIANSGTALATTQAGVIVDYHLNYDSGAAIEKTFSTPIMPNGAGSPVGFGTTVAGSTLVTFYGREVA